MSGNARTKAAALDVLGGEQPDEPGVLPEVVEGEADEACHRVGRGERAEVEVGLAGADVGVGVEQDAGVERLLVADVVVEHPLVDAGPLGDAVDARAVEPVLDELLAGGDQDVALRPPGVARTSRRGELGRSLLRLPSCPPPPARCRRLDTGGARHIVTVLLLPWQWDSPVQTNKRRIAIVGTGHRGAGTWGRDVPEACAEHVALVGLSDSNPDAAGGGGGDARDDGAGGDDRPRRDARRRAGRTRSSSAPATTPMPTSS